MLKTRLQRVVDGVRSIALHANARQRRIRPAWLNRARTWTGLIPVIPEAGIDVCALGTHVPYFQYVVLPELPRRLQIPILRIGVWMLAVCWQCHRIRRARRSCRGRHGVLNGHQISHSHVVGYGYASGRRRIELQNVDVVELSTEVEDAVSAANHGSGRYRIGET